MLKPRMLFEYFFLWNGTKQQQQQQQQRYKNDDILK
jgi:hypothetical protein